MIQQSIENAFRKSGIDRAVVTLNTQVHADPHDSALSKPTKFIGHAMPEERARALSADGNEVRKDSRGQFRRVVGSPAPLAIHELGVIRQLVSEGVVVIAAGGGGIPIYRDDGGALEGLDAVADKDLTAAVLARELGAELLLILTDVDAVYADWGTESQRALATLDVDEAQRLDASHAFGEGSMAPKVRAAIDYVRATGGRAIITELSRGLDAVHGRAGTTIAR
jgi:carbamate kinase